MEKARERERERRVITSRFVFTWVLDLICDLSQSFRAPAFVFPSSESPCVTPGQLSQRPRSSFKSTPGTIFVGNPRQMGFDTWYPGVNYNIDVENRCVKMCTADWGKPHLMLVYRRYFFGEHEHDEPHHFRVLWGFLILPLGKHAAIEAQRVRTVPLGADQIWVPWGTNGPMGPQQLVIFWYFFVLNICKSLYIDHISHPFWSVVGVQ